MVSPRFVFPVASVALAACLVEAYPMDLNPFTPGGDTIAMDLNFPARSIIPKKGSLATKVAMPTADTIGADNQETAGWLNGTTTVIKDASKATRRLFEGEDREATEQSNKDIQRLEAHYKTKMVVNYKELCKHNSSAATNPPWPSSYWPIYEDGINYAWNPNDPMPASEKYARAYGLDPAAFVKKISEVNGILGQADRQACTTEADCAPLKDGSGCAKYKNATTGYCIPKWFGICHAWSPAAIEEREPRCAVTKNNVTFQPLDIKALITQAYDGSHLQTVFTGTRFNGADEPLNQDEDGRFIDATRRDISPAFLHIAIHNIMGINKKSFIVDVTAGSEVWNQPVRSYELISATEMTPDFAAKTFFPPRTTYIFNKDAVSIVFIQLKFSWVVESNDNGPQLPLIDQFTQSAYYEYLLELDDKGDIIGGEWVRNSRKEHPDFLWFPASQPPLDSVADSVGIKYRDIRELLDASADCKQIPTNGTTLPPPTNAPPVTAPPSTAPPPTTPAPTKPDQANEADGSRPGSGSTGGDHDADDVSAGSKTGVPKPSPVPGSTTKKPRTKKPTTAPASSTPKPPPAIVPVPAPAPIPSKIPEGKGTVAPLVPAPPTTQPPANKPTLPPTPAPVPNDTDDDDDANDADLKPSTLPPKPATTPAKTPAASKTKCRAE